MISLRNYFESIKLELSNYIPSVKYILVILVLAVPPFFRQGLTGVIHPADSDFPLYPRDYLNSMSFTWFDKGWLFGNDGSYTSLAQRPFYLLPTLLNVLGFQIDLVNRVTLFLLLSLLGVSAYVMARNLQPLLSRPASVVTGIFYMYNPYMLGEIYLGHWFSFYAYAAIPIVALAVVKGLQRDQNWKIWSLMIGVLSIFILHRVRLVPILLAFFAIFVVYHLISTRSFTQLRHTLTFIGLTACTILVANISWILPSLESVSTINTLLTAPTFSAFTSAVSVSISPTFSDPLNVLRLVGYGIPTWHATGIFYETGAGAYTLIALIIVAYGTSVYFWRKNYHVRYFALSILAFTIPILLVSQITPARDVYEWFQQYLPSPANRFLFPGSFEFWSVPIALSYAYLLGVATDGFAASISNRIITMKHWSFCLSHLPLHLPNIMKKSRFTTAMISVSLIAVILVSAFPLLGGVPNDYVASIQVPAYYQDARQWLLTQPQDFVIMTIPRSLNLQYLRFDWAYGGSYSITDIFPQISPVPVLGANLPPGSRDGTEIVNLAYSSLNDNPEVGQLLSLMSVKYVVTRTDVVGGYPQSEKHLVPPSGFFLEKTFGKLSFYRSPTYSPLVSGTSNVVAVLGGKGAFVPLLYHPDIQLNKTSLVFAEDLSPKELLSIMENSHILVDYDSAINKTQITDEVRSNNIQVSYLVDQSATSLPIVLKGGAFQQTSVFWNNRVAHSLGNFTAGTIVGLRNQETALSGGSFTIYGTSVSTDSVQGNQDEIDWNADATRGGFHALYFTLNQSTWDLGKLDTLGGGIGLDVYGDGSGREIRFSFMAPEEQYFAWPLQTIYLTWSGWNRLFLPLANFTRVGSPLWTGVTALWLWEQLPQGTSPALLRMRSLARDLNPRLSILSPICEALGRNTLCDRTTAASFTWKKQSPVSYKVIASADSPFVLVLNDAYSPGWHAYANGVELKHFRANSYANGFIVPSAANQMTITINYNSEDLLVLGSYLSVGLFSLIVLDVIRDRLKSSTRPQTSIRPTKSRIEFSQPS